jgi:hypothetical protein
MRQSDLIAVMRLANCQWQYQEIHREVFATPNVKTLRRRLPWHPDTIEY